MEMVACHHKSRCSCHLERNEVESRDLRIFDTFQCKSVRRSLDSLCSLGMTSLAGQLQKLQIIPLMKYEDFPTVVDKQFKI